MLTGAGRSSARVRRPSDSSAWTDAVSQREAPQDAARTVVACALAVALAILFASVAVNYVNCYRRDPNLGHAPLVLAAAAWLAWRAPTGRSRRAEAIIAGAVAVALGVTLELAAWFVGSLGLEIAALIVTLLGTLAAAGAARRFAFPVVFLCFAAPLPDAIYQPLALTLQAWVCALSAWVLQLLGVAVLRQGSLLQLPGHTLDVGLACAGVRQAGAFLALTLAAGHLSGRRWGYRSALALMALPIALAANMGRVLLTAAIVLWFGPRWAAGTWHDLEGTTLVAFGVVLVWLSAHLLAQWPLPAFALRSDPLREPSSAARAVRARWRPVLAVLLIGIALKGAAAHHLAGAEAPEPTSLQRPLTSFPGVLGDWTGKDLPIPDSWGTGESRIRRTYRDARTDESAVVWVEYSSRGADRRHHPEVCMAVEGMREDVNARHAVPLPGDPRPAQWFRFVGAGGTQSVYYWNYTLPRCSSASLDAFQRLHQWLHDEPASVTVEVFTPDPLRGAITGFSPLPALVDCALRARLPRGSVRGSERPPVFLVNGPFAGVWR